MRKLFAFVFIGALVSGGLLLMAYKPAPAKKTLFMATTSNYRSDIEAMKIIDRKVKEGYTLKSLVSFMKYDSSNSYFLIVMEK